MAKFLVSFFLPSNVPVCPFNINDVYHRTTDVFPCLKTAVQANARGQMSHSYQHLPWGKHLRENRPGLLCSLVWSLPQKALTSKLLPINITGLPNKGSKV